MASTDRGSDFSVAPDSSTAALSGAVIPVTGIKQGLYASPMAVLFAVVARVSRATESQPLQPSTPRSLSVCFYFGKSPLL
jgi:hypothetical protein